MTAILVQRALEVHLAFRENLVQRGLAYQDQRVTLASEVCPAHQDSQEKDYKDHLVQWEGQDFPGLLDHPDKAYRVQRVIRGHRVWQDRGDFLEKESQGQRVIVDCQVREEGRGSKVTWEILVFLDSQVEQALKGRRG